MEAVSSTSGSLELFKSHRKYDALPFAHSGTRVDDFKIQRLIMAIVARACNIMPKNSKTGGTVGGNSAPLLTLMVTG